MYMLFLSNEIRAGYDVHNVEIRPATLGFCMVYEFVWLDDVWICSRHTRMFGRNFFAKRSMILIPRAPYSADQVLSDIFLFSIEYFPFSIDRGDKTKFAEGVFFRMFRSIRKNADRRQQFADNKIETDWRTRSLCFVWLVLQLSEQGSTYVFHYLLASVTPKTELQQTIERRTIWQRVANQREMDQQS